MPVRKQGGGQREEAAKKRNKKRYHRAAGTGESTAISVSAGLVPMG